MIGGMRFIGWNSFVGRNWKYFAPYLLKEPRNEKSKKKICGGELGRSGQGKKSDAINPECKKISSSLDTRFLGWHSVSKPALPAQGPEFVRHRPQCLATIQARN